MTEENDGIGEDFLTELLRGARKRTVQLEMLEETYQEVLSLAAENGWKQEEALLIVLANGLAYLKGEREMQKAMSGGVGPDEALQRMTELFMRADSMYAVMKFRAYHLAEDRRLLELQMAGMRPENEAMRQRLFQYIEEVKGLKAEIDRLRSENQQLKNETEKEHQASPSPVGQGEGRWRTRLLHLFQRVFNRWCGRSRADTMPDQ